MSTFPHRDFRRDFKCHLLSRSKKYHLLSLSRKYHLLCPFNNLQFTIQAISKELGVVDQMLTHGNSFLHLGDIQPQIEMKSTIRTLRHVLVVESSPLALALTSFITRYLNFLSLAKWIISQTTLCIFLQI